MLLEGRESFSLYDRPVENRPKAGGPVWGSNTKVVKKVKNQKLKNTFFLTFGWMNVSPRSLSGFFLPKDDYFWAIFPVDSSLNVLERDFFFLFRIALSRGIYATPEQYLRMPEFPNSTA